MRWWRRSTIPPPPLYHRWLTPAEYGARFGASEQELAQVAGWLANHGFTVEEIPASRRLVIFSGTADRWWRRFTPRFTSTL